MEILTYKCKSCNQILFQGNVAKGTTINIICKNKTFTSPRKKCSYKNVIKG